MSVAFILFVLSCVCRERPCDGLISRPRRPTDCVRDQETEGGQDPAKGCRAINRQNTLISSGGVDIVNLVKCTSCLNENILQ
jgi:hypothetical protein